MNELSKTPWAKVILAVLAVSIAFCLRYFFLGGIGTATPYVTFYPAILLSALFGGFVSGFVATLISILLILYFFVDPVESFYIQRAVDILGLVIFLAGCAMTTVVGGLMLRYRERLEKQAIDLFDLNKSLRLEIAERQQTEETHKELEIRIHQITDAAIDAIIMMNPEGRVTFWNLAAERILGYSAKEALGSNLHKLIAPKRFHQSYTDAFPLFKATGKGDAVGKTVDLFASRKDGVEIPVSLSLSALNIEGGWHSVGIVRDITERKQAESMLRESELRFEALHNASFGGIAIHDKGIILDCNKGLSQQTGYSTEELIGMDGLLLVAESWREIVRNNIASGHERPYEVMALRKNGEEYPARLEGKNVPYKGKMVRSVEFRDITDIKRTEQDLLLAKNAAEAASRAKSAFLANMSHEIRTPLNGILGMLQLLQTTSQNDEQKEYVLTAIRSSRRLASLLSDILDLSRIEAGKMNLYEERFETRLLKEAVFDLFSLAAKDKGLDLEFLFDERLPHVVVGDEARVRQILFNLIGNAIKFTQKGRVVTEVSSLPVAPPGICRVLFTVSDTGIGINDAQIKSIFEPFVQAEHSYVRRYQGAGLGLSIVARLVKLLGGEIAVESEVGTGTTIYLSIPFKMPSMYIPTPVARTPSTVTGTNLRILITEDDAVTRLSLKRLLEKAGHSVSEAEHGADALRILEQDQFDLILMDIQMPVMDGVEATRAIRFKDRFEAIRDIPIIAVTAYAMSADRDKFLGAGMNDYISKPVDIEELKAVIVRAMGKVQGEVRQQ